MLIHHRYTLLTVSHLEINIHIMLIFIILGARLRQDEDTDSRQTLKLIERQDGRTWAPEPLSVPFRCNKLRRNKASFASKGHGAFQDLSRSQGSPLSPKLHVHTWFGMCSVGPGLSKDLPGIWTPRIFKNSLLHSGWIEM